MFFTVITVILEILYYFSVYTNTIFKYYRYSSNTIEYLVFDFLYVNFESRR